MVVGVRSIGTSLSAAVAAGLRASGSDVCRTTVRPAGDPFNRTVEPTAEQQRAWRAAAARGAAFIAVADGDWDAARYDAVEFAGLWWSLREKFKGQLIDVEEALLRVDLLPGPVCLLDMGDNVGGGSPGDGTLLLHGLASPSLITGSFVCLYDPVACEQAQRAGVGGQVQLRVGGRTDRRHGDQFEANFRHREDYLAQVRKRQESAAG